MAKWPQCGTSAMAAAKMAWLAASESWLSGSGASKISVRRESNLQCQSNGRKY